MKRIIQAIVLLACVSFASPAFSQKDVGRDIKKGAKKVGNKTAEVASKGKAHVVDKKIKTKQGPNGEDIYIDGKNRYYWIDKKGHKHYVPENALKNRM
jgi:predicted small secreted protein